MHLAMILNQLSSIWDVALLPHRIKHQCLAIGADEVFAEQRGTRPTKLCKQLTPPVQTWFIAITLRKLVNTATSLLGFFLEWIA